MFCITTGVVGYEFKVDTIVAWYASSNKTSTPDSLLTVIDPDESPSVSYTHLTLPTTPYV